MPPRRMNRFAVVLVVVLVLENDETGWDDEDENEAENQWVASWSVTLTDDRDLARTTDVVLEYLVHQK